MSKIKLLKGLASLFKKKGSKTKPVVKKTEIGPPRDPEVDYETVDALRKSRKRYDLERQNLSPLTKELDEMMEASNKKIEESTNELKIMLSEIEEMTKQIDEFNKIADDQGLDEALEQINRILNPKRTLNADGGRIGKFKGGLMQLLKRINPQFEASMVKSKVPVGPQRPDAISDMEQIKNIIRDPATGYDEVLKLEDMVQNSPRYTDDQKRLFFRLIDKEKARVYITENATAKQLRMMENDPEGFEELLEQMVRDGFGESFNQGGRVGMFAGGKLIGKGIMEAAKLAKRGMKPFGKKQTYKQKVKMLELDDFQKAMKQHFDKELYNINKVRGPRGNPEAELFDLYEDIASGTRYSMLPQATRSKMLSEIDDSLKAMDVDGADYQNFRSYLFDEYKFPNETAFDDIRRGIDKGQIKTMKAEDLLDALDRASGENVIPFKPKTKKAEGGRIGFKDGDKVDTLFEPKYDSATGNYDVAGGVDIGPFDMNVRGSGNIDMDDPTMAYEAGLDLPNDFRIEGGYYDDAVMQPGMMSPEDELRLRIIKSFANGGTVPPQKGPMSEGMGTLYRRK